MSQRRNIHHLPVFASGKYYTKEKFQFPITAQDRIISQPTVLKNNSGITLYYFWDDQGTILVNSRSYPASRGLFICLGAYHYFQFVPKTDASMRITECRLSYDTFLYMAASPYYRLSEITLAVEPLKSLLTDTWRDYTEDLLGHITRISLKHGHMGGESEFYICMKLMGILQKTFQSERKPPKSSDTSNEKH